MPKDIEIFLRSHDKRTVCIGVTFKDGQQFFYQNFMGLNKPQGIFNFLIAFKALSMKAFMFKRVKSHVYSGAVLDTYRSSAVLTRLVIKGFITHV